MKRSFAAFALPFLWASVPAGPCFAAPPDERVTAFLDWEVPEGVECFDEGVFRQDVERLLGRPVFVPAADGELGLRVVARRTDTAIEVRVELLDAGEPVGERSFTAASGACRKGRETLNVVAAMLVEVPRREVQRKPPRAEEAPAEPPAPAPPSRDWPVFREPRRERPSPPLPSRPVEIDASALFAASAGLLPGATLGGEAELVLRFPDVIPFRVSGGGGTGRTVRTPEGRADFDAAWIAAGVAPVDVALGARASLFVHLSAMATATVVDTSGFVVSRRQTLWAPSAVTGVALRFRPFGGAFVALVEGNAFVPLTLHRYKVHVLEGPGPDVELYRVSAVCGQLAAGIGVEFR